jgi:hypothetical protein
MNRDYLSESNQKIMQNIINSHPKLQELHFQDNQLTYLNETIDLGDFNLLTLFNGINGYSRFVIDLKNNTITPANFFNVVKAYATKINEVTNLNRNVNSQDLIKQALAALDYKITQDKKIIALDEYLKLIVPDLNNNAIVSPDKQNKITEFENYMRLLMGLRYLDYLEEHKLKLLNDYELAMRDLLINQGNALSRQSTNLAIDKYGSSIEGIANLSDHHFPEAEAINYFKHYQELPNILNALKVFINNEKEAAKEQENKLKLANKQERNLGMVEALMIIVMMLITGIAIGICSFYIK